MFKERKYISLSDRIRELTKDEVGHREMKTILRREFSKRKITGKLIKKLRSVT